MQTVIIFLSFLEILYSLRFATLSFKPVIFFAWQLTACAFWIWKNSAINHDLYREKWNIINMIITVIWFFISACLTAFFMPQVRWHIAISPSVWHSAFRRVFIQHFQKLSLFLVVCESTYMIYRWSVKFAPVHCLFAKLWDLDLDIFLKITVFGRFF